MFKKVSILSLLALIICSILVITFHKKVFAAKVEEFKDYYSITFPEGSYFCVILQQPIDSSINKVDDLIETVITSDYYIDELLVIPNGTKAIARIIYLERAHMGRDSLVNLQFLSIIGPGNSWETPINASIVDKNSDGSIGGSLAPRTKVKLIAHQIEFIGMYDQAIATGPRAMGKELYIPPGERWIIKLNKPASFIISK